MAEKEGSAVPPQNKGSWSSFLKSIASFNGDLSTMTAPAFILSTKSLTEFSSYWTEHPSLFVAPAAEKDPAKRALLVLKWFISTLKQQYASRSEKLGSEKKPLNPFLGELFLGKWEDASGTTQLVSEQVSHHPPVTAYSIWNDQHGVRLQGYNAQKASFKTTINVKQVGHALLHLDAYNEDYLITLPPLHIEGLITGSPYVELNSSTYITSSSGFTARIDYSGKGWVSGKKNTFSALLYPTGREKDALYKIDGQWTDAWSIHDAKSKKPSSSNAIDTFDPKKTPTTPLTVAPLDQQDHFETRRAWRKVADAITKGDMDLTSSEKTIIETRQREMRKAEKESNTEWERAFFSRATADDASLGKLQALAKTVGEPLNDGQTNGVWVFDGAKAGRTSPYHPEVKVPIYERV